MSAFYDRVHVADPSLQGEALQRRRRNLWFGFLAMALGNFMAVLDIQIVASSINELRAGLLASVDEIQWVQTSYLIAEVIAVPLSGYMSRMLSTRIYFTLCALGFTLSSIACACSWSLGSMVFFRVLQGLLGGGMIPTAFAAMFLLFPDPRRRALPQTLTGLLTMFASSIGPTVGGYVTDSLSWHWLFLLNIVPGFICGGAVWALLRIDRPNPQMLKQFDLPGLVFMSMFLGGFEYTLDEGPRKDWFSEDSVAICAVMAAVGGLLFFWRVFTTPHPIVDLRAFRNRNFATASLMSAVIGISMFTGVYLTPVFLGEVRGFTPVQIGRVMMIQGGTMFLVAPLAGRFLARMDPRLTITAGFLLLTAAGYVNSFLTVDWGLAQYLLPQMMRGVGFIFSFIPLTSLAFGTLAAAEVHNASGLFNVTRNIGGALGLATVSTLIQRRTWLHWQQLAESTRITREPVREALSHMQGALKPALGDGSQIGSFAMLADQVRLQTAALTYADMYLMLAVVSAAALLMLPLVQKPRSAAADVAAH